MKGKTEHVKTEVIDGVTVIRERRIVGDTYCKRCQTIRAVLVILLGTIVVGIVTRYVPLLYEVFTKSG